MRMASMVTTIIGIIMQVVSKSILTVLIIHCMSRTQSIIGTTWVVKRSSFHSWSRYPAGDCALYWQANRSFGEISLFLDG
jgi:hypothetical protein